MVVLFTDNLTYSDLSCYFGLQISRTLMLTGSVPMLQLWCVVARRMACKVCYCVSKLGCQASTNSALHHHLRR
jgi:hypothetical protein